MGMRYLGLLLPLVAGCVSSRAENVTKPKYDPPFIISAWCGPVGDLEHYKEYADCGFNVVLGAPKEQIAFAKAAGIKAIVSGGPADVPKYADDPTVVGIFLTDEPGASKFAELGKLSQAIQKANPRYIPYINLLPTYASPEQLGTPTYEEHIRRFIDVVKPPLVSWDHYALYGANERPDYFENLEIVSRQCRKAGIPFVQIILSVPHFSYRDPNEADLRWQVYTTLAYGAKGIIYFTYTTPPGTWCRSAIISQKGERNVKYEYVKRLNRKLHVLAPLLVGLDGVRVAHTDPVPMGASCLDDTFPAASADGMPMTFGWLQDADGRDYLFVVNRAFDYQKGLIRNWEIRGPYTKAGKTSKQLLDVPFAPETPEESALHWPTAGVRVSGRADLTCLRNPPPNSIAYLRTRVKSATKQEAVLDLRTSDDTRTWFNGKLLLTTSPANREIKEKVVLKPGWNTLLLKLARGGPMTAEARFIRPDGGPLSGVEVERDLNLPSDRADGTVVLRGDVKNVVEISQKTGKPVKAAFEPGAKRLAVSLEPGEGRLFRLEPGDSHRAVEKTTTPGKRPAPAAATSPDLRLDPNTGMTLETERNGMPAGTTLFSTASCMDYSLFPLVDGIRDRKDLGWQGSSWASTEDLSPHGIEIRLGKPRKGGRFQITWAFDRHNPEEGHWFASRNYCIQVKDKAGDPWKTVADVKGNQATVSSHPLPKEPFGFLRIYQLPCGGDPSRPNIMWVGQIELTDAEKLQGEVRHEPGMRREEGRCDDMNNESLDVIYGDAAPPAVAAEKPVILWASDPIRPGEAVMIQGHAFTEDAVVEASLAPGKPMRKLQVLDRSEQCLKALIPADWKADVFELQVRTGAGKAAALLNRPAAVWWVGDLGDRQTPGGRFRICGRNMLGDPKGVRVRLTGPKGVKARIEKAEAFSLTAVLPADTPPGEHQLQAHNGWGKEAGWSDPIPFVVGRAKPWPQQVFNVMEFGAKGRFETDDTAAVQAALAKAKANGGGIIYFARGRYEIRKTLKVPRFTLLRGEKREWVELLWPDQPKPVVLVKGTNSFGMEELTLSAFNYLDGIMSDEGSVPGAGDVFLRRIRVRALRYSRLKTQEEVHRRFVESAPHSEGGCTVGVGGRNIEITDCDLYGSGRGLVLMGVKGGRVTGNKIHNGRHGWVCLSGMDGLVFENNEIIGADLMSAGSSLNTFYNSYGCQNVYFAHNRIRTIFGCDREGTSTDGGGGSHAGHIVSADGVKLVLSDKPNLPVDIWYKKAKPGMGVYILEGRGAGQWRRVVSQKGRTVEIDRPWLVVPDRTSIVAIANFQGNYLFIGNDYSDATCGIQTFGISIGHVIAGNTASRAGGFHVWGLVYGGVQPSWYCQLIDNQILEGNGILGPRNGPPSKGSHIAAIGQINAGLAPPLVRCVVMRRNHLHNNSRVALIGAVKDAVVEHNTVENADVGIHVDSTVTGALVRENKFVNVDQPLIRTEKKKGEQR